MCRWPKADLGQFGPRGLASIVYMVMVIGAHIPGIEPIMSTFIWTILLSVARHGLMAIPLAKLYGVRANARDDASLE